MEKSLRTLSRKLSAEHLRRYSLQSSDDFRIYAEIFLKQICRTFLNAQRDALQVFFTQRDALQILFAQRDALQVFFTQRDTLQILFAQRFLIFRVSA